MRDIYNKLLDATVAQGTPANSDVIKVSYAEDVDGVQKLGDVDVGREGFGENYIVVKTSFGTANTATITVSVELKTDASSALTGNLLSTTLQTTNVVLGDGGVGKIKIPQGVQTYLGAVVNITAGGAGQTADVYVGIEGDA